MKLINTIKLSTVNHGFVVAYQISFKVLTWKRFAIYYRFSETDRV